MKQKYYLAKRYRSENELLEAIYKIMELGVNNVIVKGVP